MLVAVAVEVAAAVAAARAARAARAAAAMVEAAMAKAMAEAVKAVKAVVMTVETAVVMAAGGGDGDGGGDGGCNGGGDRWEMSRRVNIATFKCSLFAVSLAAVSTPHACHASNNWKLIMRATARWSAERTRSLCHEDELHCNHARLMPMCIKQNR